MIVRAARAGEEAALTELAIRSKGHWGHDAAFLERARPELTVRPSRQRYDHVAPGTVRYTDLGVFAGFTEEVTFDEDGLVTRYPGLAVAAGPVEPA